MSFEEENPFNINLQTVGININQYNSFLSIFKQYDNTNSGNISVNDFINISRELGEDFDIEEVQEAIRILDSNNTQKIGFVTLISWWFEDMD